MFIKLTRSKSRTYAQLVESFRVELGLPGSIHGYGVLELIKMRQLAHELNG